MFDIFIIGGGINGSGIARDATGRGYKVGLAEQFDFGSQTSSWSTKGPAVTERSPTGNE